MFYWCFYYKALFHKSSDKIIRYVYSDKRLQCRHFSSHFAERFSTTETDSLIHTYDTEQTADMKCTPEQGSLPAGMVTHFLQLSLSPPEHVVSKNCIQKWRHITVLTAELHRGKMDAHKHTTVNSKVICQLLLLR